VAELALLGRQLARPPSARPVVEARKTVCVITGHPSLDGASPYAQSLSDLRGGLAATRQNHGMQPQEAILALLAIREGLELSERQIFTDEHGRPPWDSRQLHMHSSNAQGRADII
jgi:hypothetical protein